MEHSALPTFDVVVIGGNPAALSLARGAQRSGLERVAVLAPGERVVPGESVGRHRLEIHYQSPVRRLVAAGPDRIVVETDHLAYAADVVVVADRGRAIPTPPPFPIPEDLADHVHVEIGPWATGDMDVLVAGEGESAAEMAIELCELGAGVVLAIPEEGITRMSRLAREELRELESQRRLTVLWRSMPDGLESIDGLPMVYFPDRRTPDLQFDHVVLAYHPAGHSDPLRQLGIEVADDAPLERLVLLSESADEHPQPVSDMGVTLPVGGHWNRVRELFFPDLEAPPPIADWIGGDRVAALRETHYNATITSFDPHHSDLWVLRLRPDHGDASHLPGQYATVGLGHWEPRIDNATEDLSDKRWASMIRRSYSMSTPIFDEHGYLFDRSRADELEFYIVLVRPNGGRVPSLTPRLALKQPGDRIYLGAKVAGRYTLERNQDPTQTLLFLGTGTGEAPHNAMVLELLRKGHLGPIVNAVTVRFSRDLAYLEKHRELERRYANYHYLPLTTRDPGVPKRYLQDAIVDGTIEQLVGSSLDPESTHVFLCGNPSMIGLPTWDGDTPTYPETVGVVQLLAERGFTLDRRGHHGNIHYEEYW